MANRYRNLTNQERAVISIGFSDGETVRDIADRLSRSPSTVSRELARGAAADGGTYCPSQGAETYRARRRHCGRPRKLVPGTWLHRWVADKLRFRRWSPEQMAGRLRRMHPDEPSHQVSHETIYAAIYAHPRGALKQALIDALRQHKPAWGRRRRTAAGGGMVPEALGIANRPEAIDRRLMPGHWEGDLIKGAMNRSAVGTLVERKTWYVVLSKTRSPSAEAALDGFSRQTGSGCRCACARA